MGKSDVPSILTFECRSVLDTIQNEFDQLQKEDASLSKLKQDLVDLVSQRNILVKRKGFNEKYCLLCCSAFNLLFKRKLQCQECHFFVCRSCCSWDAGKWMCSVCEKQKLFDEASREWICGRIKTNFSNFGAVKALQNFWRNRRISDSENDSGYEATGELPLMKFLSSHSLNKDMKMCDCDEDEEELGDEEELAEIQYSIETILEGLLGGTLDDALVDQLYPASAHYLNLFSTYHTKLVEVIQNLSKALQKALHNLPAENGITPTTAHAALKSIISELVEACQEIPPLQAEEEKEPESSVSLPFDFADIFSSYDSLVATAVINKVIEESQAKFKQINFTSSVDSFKTEDANCKQLDEFVNVNEDTDVYENVETTEAPFDMPVECVQIEEIEEITQEFTDSEDDKLSSISKWSASLQSIDEIGSTKHPDLDIYIDVDRLTTSPTPFPEFGCDLVDDPSSNHDSGVVCHPTSVANWEENWLFRKRKRLPLYSNLKYQLMTYCDEPPSMLIPCPSESADVLEQDDFSSELSENHSAGSLEFSSDPDDSSLEMQESFTDANTSTAVSTKSEKMVFAYSSPIPVESEKQLESKKSALCQENAKTTSLKDMKSSEHLQTLNESNFLPKKGQGSQLQRTPLEKSPSTQKKCVLNSNKINSAVASRDPVAEDNLCIGTPPRPGTIAEREHQKWLNAVPLKNNPYSAENISKRSSYGSNSHSKEPVTSFEEFERKLSVSSETSDPGPNKVNCGPKSIDSELYKRDYYVNQENDTLAEFYPLQKCTKYMYRVPDDCFDPLSEEALNSFEEKIYVKSGKVFTLENRVRRLEREIKDSQTSPNLSRVNTPISPDPKQFNSQVMNGRNRATASDEESPLSPAKRNIMQLKTDSVQVFPVYRSQMSVTSNKADQEKVKKSKPCRKVHSLTARSLSREFRDLAKVNLPKPMNRTIQVPSGAGEDCEPIEREGLCSPESVQSTASTGQTDNVHGYTSDESNTSANSTTKSKSRKHISRSILERATYWERRAEQGLLSDASVSEEFPGIEITPE